MDCFLSKSQFKNDNFNSNSNDSTNNSNNKSNSNNSNKKRKKTNSECTSSSTSGRRSKTKKINVGLDTNSDDDTAIQWFSSSSCQSTSSRLSNNGNTSSKRKRHSSSSLDDKDPELGQDGPSAKRQHIAINTSTCYTTTTTQNSDPSSSVPSSVYPSPVDEFVEIDTRSSSDCNRPPPTYNSLPTPESPNSIEDEIIPESSSIASFETASTTSDSECTLHQASENTDSRSSKVKSFDDYVTLYDCMTPVEPSEPRSCPLPALSWANASDVWNFMCKKDEAASYLRDSTMLDNHPGLQPRMRAILLDWLIEVCEVYKLHRETYYLAVDYLDRYLSTQKRVQKTHLQLIGITCLFIAAKVEEIYPPKIAEFAYVTDGACLEEDILQHEIILLQALDWSISPMTAMGWLGVYMQLNVSNRTPASLAGGSAAASYPKKGDVDDTFIYPQFSGLEYVQTAQLLDLCSLDVGIGNYAYSVIAAAAISHSFDKETALRVSGLDWVTIQPCARWMEPFFKVISEESEHLYLMEQNEQIASKSGLAHLCPNIVTDDSHIIQTHTTSMTMFDRAYLISEQNAAMDKTIKTEASPATGLKCPEGLLTPPSSSRKPLEDDIEDNDDDDCPQQQDNHRVQTSKMSSSSTTLTTSSSSLSSSTTSALSLKENQENVPNI
ncbi:G1/S-specific cyclin-E [Episyrphus balteatus]|uniref:G1/S-specific cyclin-E n=1 Tax=Episyrphus balteatus TaxID=286459 RepID=UPI002484EE46|nr:G1/S-specific cyclin-E [Episyrphus balteatus]